MPDGRGKLLRHRENAFTRTLNAGNSACGVQKASRARTRRSVRPEERRKGSASPDGREKVGPKNRFNGPLSKQDEKKRSIKSGHFLVRERDGKGAAFISLWIEGGADRRRKKRDWTTSISSDQEEQEEGQSGLRVQLFLDCVREGWPGKAESAEDIIAEGTRAKKQKRKGNELARIDFNSR